MSHRTVGWSPRHVDEMPQPALLLSKSTGEILHANASARAAFGSDVHALPEPLAICLRSLLPPAQPEIHAERKTEEPLSCHCSITTLDGAQELLIFAAEVWDEEGHLALLVTIADMTAEDAKGEVEAKEATLRALIQANFAVCYDWELATGACLFSGRFDELLGLPPEEHPSSIEAWLRLIHPEDVDRVIRSNRESIESLLPYLDEYRMIHKDGRIVVVSDSGQLLSDEQGRAVRMVGGIRDITEEHEMQRALEERNVALRVILDQRGQDRLDLERTIRENVNRLLLPALDRMRHSLGSLPQVAQVDAMRQTLEEMVRPFAPPVSVVAADGQVLTPREAEILDLVRSGKTSQEIADLLFLTPATISFHRANIRRKLHVPKGGHRLKTHLALLDQQSRGRDAERR